MRPYFLTCLFLLPLNVGAQEIAVPTAPPTPHPLSMAGKFGVGISVYDNTSASLRYWLSDQTAIEAFATQVFSWDTSMDCGLGLKTNLATPSRDLLVQGIIQASYTRTDYIPLPLGPQTYDAWDLAIGLGFEAFMPFCEWLSVEDSVAVDFSYRPNPYGTVWGIFGPSGGAYPALTPLAFTVHAYF